MARQQLSTTIQSDLSTGTLNTPRQNYVVSTSMYDPPSNTRIDDAISALTAMHAYQFPLDSPKYYFFMSIAHYHRDSIMRVGSSTPFAHVFLPLPMNLVDRQDVRWEETALGMGAGMVADSALGMVNDPVIGDKIKELWDKRSQINQELVDNVYNSLDPAQKSRLAQLGIGSSIVLFELLGGGGSPAQNKAAQALVGAASAVMGISPNQFVTILMKGPSYKVHNLSWRLLPRNPKESEQIRKIIQLLNNCMAPGLAFNRLVFTFPKVFFLGFRPNAKYLFKFKPAVLKTMQVNYDPGKVPAFYSSTQAPEAVEISCQFMELEYWLRNDFINSNIPTEVYGDNTTENITDLDYGISDVLTSVSGGA